MIDKKNQNKIYQDKTNENIEKSKIWLEKDGIVRLKTGKLMNEEILQELVNNYKEIAKNLSTKPKIIIDIRLSSPSPSYLFRKTTAEILMGINKEPGFEKLVMWGGTTVIKVVALFIITATRLKNIRYFSTEKEALNWLKK
jgi:hypothetical protein